MKFTIVTPVLNGALFLPEVLRSVGVQAYEDWEHIIVDGGSRDASRDIARDWASRDRRVTTVSAPGSSMYEAIFAGFSRAEGEVLSWLNCDDLYTPWALATVAAYFERNDAAWVTGLPGTWDAQGLLRVVRPAPHFPRWLIRSGWCHERFVGFLQQESMFFRKELIDALSQDERNAVCTKKLAGDFLLWRMFAQRADLKVIPTALAGFRVHGNNMSTYRRDEYLEEVRATKAPVPPALLARPAELIARLYSAYMLQRSIEAEDNALRRQTSQNPRPVR